MIYRKVQGITVPALGFGTYLLEGKECREGVEDALRIGYRHIDTAQSYNNEDEVGKASKTSGLDREKLFVTTKIWRDQLHRKDVIRSTEESLRKLRMDYVDLLLIHWPNEEVELEETLEAMQELQHQEKTRLIGISNFPPSLYRQALELAPVACNQVEYHPMLGQEKLLEITRENECILTAYSPLGQGKALINNTVKEIGEKHGKTAAQVALRWLLQQARVVTIPRSSSHKHRQGNFDVFDFELNEEEMERVFELEQGKRLVTPPFAPDWEE